VNGHLSDDPNRSIVSSADLKLHQDSDLCATKL
jgi:hypothetical protein